MARRTRLKRARQKGKHLKRPRSWHHTSQRTLGEIWAALVRLKRRQGRVG